MNPDPADLQNTLIKMANKRAYVDAVLKATGASRMFMEDMDELGALTGQFEKASSKQRDYIKKLYSRVPPTDAIADMSSICGREIGSFDDIFRPEASRIIEARKGGAAYQPPPAASSGAAANAAGAANYDGELPGGQKYVQSKLPSQGNDALVCSGCAVVITAPVRSYSLNKYGRALCRECQEEMNASMN